MLVRGSLCETLMRIAVVVVGVWCLPGCTEQEPIRTTQVPKSQEPDAATAKEYRIIGAMFPAEEPVWFFKLAAPAEDLDAIAADFEKMLGTVRFPNGTKNLPIWDMPEGWKSGGENPAKMATDTIVIPVGKGEVVATVTRAGGDTPSNVKRWADQVGMASFNPMDLSSCTKPLATTPPGLWTDVRGPKNPNVSRGPFMGGR